jgi:hypothetical protein
LSWEDQINELNDKELRRFISNLIKYHKSEEIELITKADRMAWNGIIHGLRANEAKYENRVAANRENGKRGGAPVGNQNASKGKSTQSTQNNPNNLIIGNSKEIIVNSEKIIGKREKETVNTKLAIENGKESNESRELENDNVEIENVFSDADIEISLPIAEAGKGYDRLPFVLSELEDLENINPVRTLEEYRVIMDQMFQEEESWRKDLVEVGLHTFLAITKHCHLNKDANIFNIKCYFKLLLVNHLSSIQQKRLAS